MSQQGASHIAHEHVHEDDHIRPDEDRREHTRSPYDEKEDGHMQIQPHDQRYDWGLGQDGVPILLRGSPRTCPFMLGLLAHVPHLLPAEEGRRHCQRRVAHQRAGIVVLPQLGATPRHPTEQSSRRRGVLPVLAVNEGVAFQDGEPRLLEDQKGVRLIRQLCIVGCPARVEARREKGNRRRAPQPLGPHRAEGAILQVRTACRAWRARALLGTSTATALALGLGLAPHRRALRWRRFLGGGGNSGGGVRGGGLLDVGGGAREGLVHEDGVVELAQLRRGVDLRDDAAPPDAGQRRRQELQRPAHALDQGAVGLHLDGVACRELRDSNIRVLAPRSDRQGREECVQHPPPDRQDRITQICNAYVTTLQNIGQASSAELQQQLGHRQAKVAVRRLHGEGAVEDPDLHVLRPKLQDFLLQHDS
mmetsp:Transcript_82648/g.267533  ORF Transcript_82648/g.267533 Transcript_82648/m.267533 type:complete len:420 (+) Transcript_82648:404-1663(+)